MNTLKKWIKRYLKFCFSFKGRLNRKAFFFSWLIIIVLSIAWVLAGTSLVLLIFSQALPFYLKIFLPLLAVLCFLGIIPLKVGGISIQIKRLHDLNFSGRWFFVIMLLNILASLKLVSGPLENIAITIYIAINLIYFISLFFIKGSKGRNKYGQDPLKLSET